MYDTNSDGEEDTEVDSNFRMTLATYLADNDNVFGADPMLTGISRTANGGLDPRPMAGSPALSGAQLPSGSFFESVSYSGAFGPTNWLQGWTALSQLGYLSN